MGGVDNIWRFGGSCCTISSLFSGRVTQEVVSKRLYQTI